MCDRVLFVESAVVSVLRWRLQTEASACVVRLGRTCCSTSDAWRSGEDQVTDRAAPLTDLSRGGPGSPVVW